MSYLLKDKNIVLTGCLKGIGRATMEVFAMQKANIFACAQYQDAEFVEGISMLSEEHGIWIKPVYFDLSDGDSIKAATKEIHSAKIPIHGLVNIAGMVHNGLFYMTSINKLKEVFEINYFSQMQFTQGISKIMLRYKIPGSIVNVSSVTGIDGNAGQLSYGSSKAALNLATKTLAIELGEHGIRVNSIAPGVILTDMTTDLPKDKFDLLLERVKFNRVGSPEEVANVLVYLVSDMSTYVTGQILRIDGGMAL